jgi:hypothetical protein
MPRPKSKEELLELSQKNYTRLNDFVDSFSPEEQTAEFPEGTMNRNIRDVLAHLHHWHLMMLEWYEIGMKGEKPEMPAEGYTWKTVPELNRAIWEKYKNTDLQIIREKLQISYLQIQEVIQSHTNKELFEKKYFRWTGSTSLGSYLVSATSSHYGLGI